MFITDAYEQLQPLRASDHRNIIPHHNSQKVKQTATRYQILNKTTFSKPQTQLTLQARPHPPYTIRFDIGAEETHTTQPAAKSERRHGAHTLSHPTHIAPY